MAKNKSDFNKFEELREQAFRFADKAQLKNKTGLASKEPFVLGEEYGFSRPITVQPPKFSERLKLEKAFEAGDIVEILKVFFKQDFQRVILKLDEMGDDADLVAFALVMKVIEHFYGQGIEDFLAFID